MSERPRACRHVVPGQPAAGRRRFLRSGFTALAACLSLPLWNLLAGCAGGSQKAVADEPFEVPLALLPVGERKHLEHLGRPIELHRTEHGVTARLLICTHQGCTVAWHEDRREYVCPCHEGRFDADGEVVYGMPRGPLKTLPVSVRDGMVVVEG